MHIAKGKSNLFSSNTLISEHTDHVLVLYKTQHLIEQALLFICYHPLIAGSPLTVSM